MTLSGVASQSLHRALQMRFLLATALKYGIKKPIFPAKARKISAQTSFLIGIAAQTGLLSSDQGSTGRSCASEAPKDDSGQDEP
ncbi:hypothetical protein NBH19_09955 [Rhizobium sp. S95]|uniref:Uncharacterized protein n=1 Tax=Ciceribacter sichuanensis TaxID=2949647 RepID=A0AAJ1BW51_9HYPH|nr:MULTISPECIES: hypothetical protein [unclassified Ciceribacter]MCM2396403.1 hypothetical protein [Ciceribacter sp. S95]MCM2402285.1 hypothetical protein [Ciceribacter sp. S153]MCO5957446.1 hypothetical protein [Ciceribacter sp. S101]